MEPLKILVLYGGKAATVPRDDLLDWLNSRKLQRTIGKNIDARKVAEMTAHMEGSIDQRVEDMMNWADKAIFLLTPDERSEYGAPNVLEEFGRWIGQKGRRTGLTLRHEEVKVHSNASGLVYVGFTEDPVEECRDRLVAFINDPIPPEDSNKPSDGSSQQPIHQTTTTDQSISVGRDVGGDITTGDGNVGGKGNIVGDGNTQNQAGRDVNIHHHHHYGNDRSQSNNLGREVQVNENMPVPTGEPRIVSLPELSEFLRKKYGKDDLLWLCRQLNVDADDFDSSRTGLILDLLPFLQRRSRLGELLDRLAEDEDQRLQKWFGPRENLSIAE